MRNVVQGVGVCSREAQGRGRAAGLGVCLEKRGPTPCSFISRSVFLKCAMERCGILGTSQGRSWTAKKARNVLKCGCAKQAKIEGYLPRAEPARNAAQTTRTGRMAAWRGVEAGVCACVWCGVASDQVDCCDKKGAIASLLV